MNLILWKSTGKTNPEGCAAHSFSFGRQRAMAVLLRNQEDADLRRFFHHQEQPKEGGNETMPSHRMGRTTEDIRRELTAIFRELKDPRVQQGLISIVRVEVTNDLSHSTVYVSAMQGLEQANTAVAGLKSASGFIRRELGRRLKLRHVPELHFLATNSIEYSANISKILNDLRSDDHEDHSE